jgi:hypothetical protein
MPAMDKITEGLVQDRKKANGDNPFLIGEKIFGEVVETQLNLYRNFRDAMTETMIFSIYTSPIVKAMISPNATDVTKRRVMDLRQMPEVYTALTNIETGGVAEAVVRILQLLNTARGYVRRTRLERELIALSHSSLFPNMAHEDIVKLVHQQSLIVDFEPKRALDTLSVLLNTSDKQRKAMKVVMEIAGPRETMHPFALKMYNHIDEMLTKKNQHSSNHEANA